MQSDAEHKAHWDAVYAARPSDGLSWYQPSLARSLAFIAATGLGPAARLIDIGGGASNLVDDLLALGYRHLTVLDISSAAIDHARTRLGSRAESVSWRTEDITQAVLPRAGFELWHDRAVFHFLTRADDREKYRAALRTALTPGGYLVIATFGPHGPLRCSGLEVVRYDIEQLQTELGNGLLLVQSEIEHHRTPAGKDQEFLYALFRRA